VNEEIPDTQNGVQNIYDFGLVYCV
jgi:hypothetical protein